MPAAVAIAVAGALALVAWHFLPYETLERQTPEERFALWESVMWMSGLALGFFGLAALFGSTDLYASSGSPYLNRSADHIRIRVQEGIRGRMLFSDLPAVPWFMMQTGGVVLLVAIAARAFLLE